jgi:hypothetical protein
MGIHNIQKLVYNSPIYVQINKTCDILTSYASWWEREKCLIKLYAWSKLRDVYINWKLKRDDTHHHIWL